MRYIFKSIIISFVAFIWVGCAPKQEVKPENLIEQEQMVLVLKDICKVEARFQRRLSLHGKSNSDLVFENYKLVFDDNNVDMDRFKTSYSYYQDSPALMQQLYDSVIVELTKEQSALKADKSVQEKK